MTNDEAIEIIECGDISNRWGKDGEEVEKMAIEALKQKHCEDAISRQKVNILVDELARAISDERCCMPRGRSTGAIMQDILDLPPVTPQEPFDDTILTLTKTLTKRVVTQVTEDMDNFIFTTIKPWCEAKEQREISKRDLEQALTQYFGKEPCEDAVSKQEVAKILLKYVHNAEGKAFVEFLIGQINDLPPVNPKEPRTEVLDKIRAEIDEQYDRVHPYDISCAEGLEMALNIVDKYIAEEDKA